VKSVIPYAFIAALLILWGSSGVVQIESSERGALYRFGKLADEPLSAGIHLTLPWPFDRVEVYETGKVQQLSVGYISDESIDNLWTAEHGTEEHRLLLGGGEELVSVNLRIEYRIGDLHAYLKNNAAPEATLQAMAYEALTMRTIGTDLDTLLSTDRVAFADDMCAELRAGVIERGLGLEVVGVVLESIHPPVEIAEIYQKLVSAGIDAERIILLAEAYAAEKVITAETGKLTLIGEATAEKNLALAKAHGSVAEFLAAVEADTAYPDFYRYEKYLAAIADAYGNATIVLVGEGVNTQNIYIGNLSK
jgi:regulator of protease activity HflC (stomatin/prohibitin superfamily)